VNLKGLKKNEKFHFFFFISFSSFLVRRVFLFFRLKNLIRWQIQNLIEIRKI
jgi:hypothetical protein